MPDQNGGGNQGGGPINPFAATNPFQPKDDSQPKKDVQPKLEAKPKIETQPKTDAQPKSEAHTKPINPFATGPFQPKKDEFAEAEGAKSSSKVEPINPFSQASPVKKSEAVEGEIVVKKPEEAKKTHEVPKTHEAPKVHEVPKAQETPKVQEVPKAQAVPKVHKAKPIDTVKVVEPQQKSANEEGIDEFKHQVMDILDQAGITKGTLIKTIVIIGVAVLMIMGYVYGWYGMIVNKFEGRGVDQGQQETETVNKDKTTPKMETPSSSFGLVSAYIFGLEFSGANTPIQAVPIGTWGSDAGVRAASIFGIIADERKVKFIEYIALLRQLQNIYDTDVYALLDMSVDRRAALQQHMNDLVFLLDKAGMAYSDLDAQLALFDQQYAPIILGKDTYEANFFNSLYAYYGDAAYGNLGMFVKSSQDAVAMKAYFNAYKTLRDLLGAYINSLRTRYSDISANTEALIKGVRVFYVPNSDIKTIIKLGE